jgi:hypothetical protein
MPWDRKGTQSYKKFRLYKIHIGLIFLDGSPLLQRELRPICDNAASKILRPMFKDKLSNIGLPQDQNILGMTVTS